MTVCNNFAASRVTFAGAIIEDTCGVAKFPTSAKMIAVTAAPDANQSRPNVDSEERANTRGVLAQFQSALDAATWSAPHYLRPAGTANTEAMVGDPQASDVYQAFFGAVMASSGMQVNGAGVDDTVTTIPFTGLIGEIPTSGVIKIENELVYYQSVTWTDPATKVAGSFTGCTRGYGETTAAAHADTTVIGMWSKTFRQSVRVPTLTWWFQQDFIFHRIEGSAPDSATLSVSNEGGASFEVSGQGFRLFTLSSHTTNAVATATATEYVTDDPKLAEVGMYIQNATNGDDNGGAGYKITAVDEVTGVVSLGSPIAVDWASGDSIEGFLPEFEPIGDPTENRQTVLTLDGSLFNVRSTSLNLSEPKTFPTDEVGTDGPSGFIPGTRSYDIEINVYASKDKMELYKDSYDNVEKNVEVTYGVGLGHQIVLTLPRVKLSSPTISEDGDTYAITFSGKALETSGEDSMTMRFE